MTLHTTEQNLDPNELDPAFETHPLAARGAAQLDPAAAPKPIEPRPPLPSEDKLQAALEHHHVRKVGGLNGQREYIHTREDPRLAYAIGQDRSVVARLEAVAKAAQAAGPPLLYALRLWASVCLALFLAFWLEFAEPGWAGLGAAIASLPILGTSVRKGEYLMISTVVGTVAAVVLAGFFPQDGLANLGLLAVWCGICAFGATVLRNFALRRGVRRL